MAKRIAVVGDALTDVYVHGTLQPSQDGCDKFVETHRVVCPGGAANAVQCLQHCDCIVQLFAQVEAYRGVKTRFLASGQEPGLLVWRHDDETRKPYASSDTYVRNAALDALYFADAVLLSDYEKGLLTLEFVRQVVSLCRQRNIPCVADAKREPSFYDGALIKCNRSYAAEYGHSLAGRPMTIITNGAGCPVTPSTSMPYFDDGATIGCWMVPHHNAPVPCINHVGAGDCFAAHLTLALSEGKSLRDAAAYAHSAGRVYVQHPHNRAPHPSEISRDLG